MNSNLTQLGNKVDIPENPTLAKIETIPNTWLDSPYCIRMDCPEFVSCCEVTGQPDFAHIIIDYIPWNTLIESKSLKLFLGSFRNYNCFHERSISYIGHRLVTACNPRWIRVAGFFRPRGGISITPYFCLGKRPEGNDVYIPELQNPL